MSLLTAKNLQISFLTPTEKLPAVVGVDVCIEEGEIMGLVGESGSGKSILSLSLMDLVNETTEVTYDSRVFLGKEVKDMAPLRGKEISMIFQEPMSALNPLMKIGKQIEEVLEVHHYEGDLKKRVLEVMEEVGLPRVEAIYDSYPHELSGGLLQRAMIAMAVILRPKLIIADEPTTALDVQNQDQIIRLMRKLHDTLGVSILFISHNLSIVKSLCDRVTVLYLGMVMESAETLELIKNPLHPYTLGLIRSVAEPSKKPNPLYAIPGRVPALNERPKGCPFSPRCEWAKEKCFEELPPLREEKGRKVRCFYPLDLEEK
ncbi:ABC transporter ATP-binding protein [Guggenheimella bovis]